MKKIISFSFLFIVLSSISIIPYSKATLFEHIFETRKGVFKTVQLPFPYKSFENHEREKIQLIHQGEIAILNNDSPFDFMYTGPLGPCIGIIIKNTQNNKVLLAHKDYLINIKSIKPYIQKMGEINALDVTIFSINIGDNYRGKSWYMLHEGRSQEEEINFIKNYFIEDLKFSDNTIKTKFYTPNFNSMELGNYVAVERYILIDKKGELFTTSMFKEKLFVNATLQSDLDNNPIEKHLPLFFLNLYKLGDQFVNQYRPEVLKPHNYGDLDFVYNGEDL